MKLQLKITNDTFFIFISFLYFSISNISRMLSLIGIPREISYIFFLILFAVFISKTLHKVKPIDVIIMAVIIIPTSIGLLKYHSYIDSSTTIFATIILFLPSYYYFRMCDIECITLGLKHTIYFSAIYLLFDYFTRVRVNYNYNMAYAYWIVVPICGLIYNYFKNRRLYDIILALICFYTLVVSGCRGALIICVICCFYYYAAQTNMSKNKLAHWGLFGILICYTYYNLNGILNFLSQYSSISRNIKKIVTGQFLISTNRDAIYMVCKDLIDKNYWGYGPLASRKLISGYPYPHSIFYELQLDYGVIVGETVLVILIVMALILLWKNRKDDTMLLCGIVCLVGFVSLFLSSTYYQEYTIPAIIAMFINDVFSSPKRQKLTLE